MKTINITFFLLAIILTAACHRHTAAQVQDTSTYNQAITNAQGTINLLGKSTRDRLQQEPFGIWFNKNYTDYTIDSATANQLKPLVKNKRFVIFMGTWCGDSRREVPRIYKLLDYCGVQPSQIELINLNNSETAYKQSPGHEEKGLYIFRVPDLLVYNDKNELSRVIESPVASWEKDLLTIVRNNNYTPHYSGAAMLAQLYRTTPFEKLEKDTLALASQLKPLTAARGELHSFGNLLLSAGDTAKALLTYQVNTQLFPADPVAWTTLAGARLKTGDKTAAIACCRIAMRLQPDNKEASAILQQLGQQ
ncbi:MAG: tetratricopeptide repeat protein [Chitinophagaceae bacterium]